MAGYTVYLATSESLLVQVLPLYNHWLNPHTLTHLSYHLTYARDLHQLVHIHLAAEANYDTTTHIQEVVRVHVVTRSVHNILCQTHSLCQSIQTLDIVLGNRGSPLSHKNEPHTHSLHTKEITLPHQLLTVRL